MTKLVRCLLLAGSAAAAITILPNEAHAQQAFAVTPAAPAVVGFTAERRGLFGWRTVYRPIVAPVATAVPVAPAVTVARPVISQSVISQSVVMARPVISQPVMSQSVVMARPVVSEPVVVGFAPSAAPVTSFFARLQRP